MGFGEGMGSGMVRRNSSVYATQKQKLEGRYWTIPKILAVAKITGFHRKGRAQELIRVKNLLF